MQLTHSLDDEVWYRFDDIYYSRGLDEYDEPRPGYDARCVMTRFSVVRHTPKGAWIVDITGRRRWVKRDARKRYACPTMEEAMESFQARKRRQVSILCAQIVRVEAALAAARREYPELTS